MRRSRVGLLLAVAFVGLVGCGGSSSPDLGILRQLVGVWNLNGNTVDAGTTFTTPNKSFAYQFNNDSTWSNSNGEAGGFTLSGAVLTLFYTGSTTTSTFGVSFLDANTMRFVEYDSSLNPTAHGTRWVRQ